MLEGICPNCGFHCYGWALREKERKICPKCSHKLKIKNSIDTIDRSSIDSYTCEYLPGIIGNITTNKWNKNN